MYKIVFYVPSSHLEEVKNRMFEQGAGRTKNYQACAWQVQGEGQFMPLDHSNPFIGKQNELSTIPEYKVEMFCADEYIHAVINALKSYHPYEEPAYFVWQVANL